MTSIEKKEDIIILLTACIQPDANMPFLKRADPMIRLNDYIQTLSLYLQQTQCKIVFAENSGYDLGLLRKLDNDNRIEFIQINKSLNITKRGKGYNELILLKYAIQNSKCISDSTVIVKITGRLSIINIKDILKKILMTSSCDLWVDLHSFLSYADSRCFIARPVFFYKLCEYLEVIDDQRSIHFEDILSKATLLFIESGNNWHPMPSYVIYEGFSGTDNRKYRNVWIINFYKKIRTELLIKLLEK